MAVAMALFGGFLLLLSIFNERKKWALPVSVIGALIFSLGMGLG